MDLTRRNLLKLLAFGGVELLVGCGSTPKIMREEKTQKIYPPIDTLILDFDGTLTNIEEETKPYIEGYRQGLARELGFGQREIETYWNEARNKNLKNPEKYAWQLDGIPVASATSDPILICYSITDEIFAMAGKTLSQNERRDLFGKLFLENRPKMGHIFKEGADKFLSEVYDLFNGRVYIVTNNSTDNVTNRIRHLPSDHSRIQILGRANKYVVNINFKELPETINIPGLERPVYLRRQHYYKTLDKIIQEQSTEASKIVVIGDIWELDLALPQYLGMCVGLTPGLTTPKYEKDMVANYQRGFLADNLEEVYGSLKERV